MITAVSHRTGSSKAACLVLEAVYRDGSKFRDGFLGTVFFRDGLFFLGTVFLGTVFLGTVC